MRVLTACLLGFVGFGTLATIAACSDSTDSGGAGSGGASASAGSGGSSGKAGAAGSVSEAGAAGSGECGPQSVACTECLNDECGGETAACTDDCAAGLYAMIDCACDPRNDPLTCVGKFVSDNGEPAQDVIDCYIGKCTAACQ